MSYVQKSFVSAAVFLSLFVSGLPARAEFVPQGWEFITSPGAAGRGTDEYRLGDEWGKLAVTSESLEQESPAFRRAALATAMTNGATGFYLGKFGGVHVLATNYHVCSAGWYCLGKRVTFPFLQKSFKAAKFLKSWSEVDLALVTLEVKDPADEALLAEVAGNFAFGKDIVPGQELITIGFGIAGNPSRTMVASQDSDCRVFSGHNEFRQLRDPDQMNPGAYAAWSFANGCDVSHGDSGSAMVDRQSSAVVGIIWTGKLPKKPQVQSSAYLNELLVQQSEEIWSELSYAVPAAKIEQVLLNAAGTDRDEQNRATFSEMLAR